MNELRSPATRTTTSAPFRRVPRILAVGAVTLCAITAIATPQSSPASAAAGDGIAAYISPPFVQGPPSSYGATVETFNSWTSCSSLPSNSTRTFSGSCDVHDGTSYEWGGAQTTSDIPTVQSGGTPSVFVSGPLTGVLALSFATPVKYVGFWWSAGSPSDTVKFYDNTNTLIATFTTATLSTRLGGSIPTSNPFPGAATLTALDGTIYKRDYYWGRPFAYSSTTPTAIAFDGNINRNAYAHAYLNVHASGSIAFSKVEFEGNPFEFDNVAFSTSLQTPATNNVFIESVLGKSVNFMANGGSGSMASQTSNAATTLSTNTLTNPGHTFAGWSTSPTGPVVYADAASYAFSSDTILYAKWTPISYRVEYDTQGGSTVADGSYTIGASVTLPSAPIRVGHTFLGWFTGNSGGSALGATYSPPSTGAITLYARWQAVATTTTQPPVASTSTTAPPSASSSTPTTVEAAPVSESTTTATTFVAATQATPSAESLPSTGRGLTHGMTLALLGVILGVATLRRPRRHI